MPLNKEEYFAALAKRNNWNLEDESKRVEITIGTLKRLVFASHQEGTAHAEAQQKTLEGLFGDLFKHDVTLGGKKQP